MGAYTQTRSGDNRECCRVELDKEPVLFGPFRARCPRSNVASMAVERYAAVGAEGYEVNAVNSGAASVYVRAGNTWNLQGEIIPSD